MPAGEYVLTSSDPHDALPPAVERFRCAAGPAGWRYTSVLHGDGGTPVERVDLTLDARGRQVRVEVASAGWTVRGGSTGRHLLWLRTGSGTRDAVEQREEAAAFAGRSAGFLVAADRLLRLSVGLTGFGSAALRLVLLSPPALGTSVAAQRWTLTDVTPHATDLGVLPVRSYVVVDLDTGLGGDVHVGGDVVLAAPAVALRTLDGPPSLT